jgi:hypothetical protein
VLVSDCPSQIILCSTCLTQTLLFFMLWDYASRSHHWAYPLPCKVGTPRASLDGGDTSMTAALLVEVLGWSRWRICQCCCWFDSFSTSALSPLYFYICVTISSFSHWKYFSYWPAWAQATSLHISLSILCNTGVSTAAVPKLKVPKGEGEIV